MDFGSSGGFFFGSYLALILEIGYNIGMISKCKICGTEFKSKNGKRDKTCSRFCANQAITNSKIIYSPEQIQQIVDLRKQGISRDKISEQLGVSLAKIKRIIAEHNINLSPEVVQANVKQGQIEAFGSIEAWSAHCRKGLTEEVLERRATSVTIKNQERFIDDGVTTKQRYRSRHHERVKERGRQWAKDNKEYRAFMTAKRRAYKLQRTPKWLAQNDLKAIQQIYQNCPEGYHVDHIVPLKGKNVSGLHVPWNLQYLPAIENLKKKNKS